MKKILLSLAIACLAVGSASAQDVKLGLKAGPSLTTYYGRDRGASSEYQLGFNAGLFANLGLSDLLSFQPELLYSLKGNYFETGAPGAVVKSRTDLHYLTVPLLLRVDADGPFFELGPEAGFLLSAISTTEANGIKNAFDNKVNVNTLDFGLIVGVGYQIDNLSLGLRYNPSLTRVPKDVAGRQIQAYNSVLQFQLGYALIGD